MKSIKKLFTHTVLGAFVFAALMFAGIAFPAKVQAAAQYENHHFYYNPQKTLHAEIAGDHFWYYKDLKFSSTSSGRKTTLYTPKYNEQIQPVIVSNGSHACFAVQKKGSSTTTVYAANLKTKTRKVLCTYKSSYGQFLAYYGGKIYLSQFNGYDEGAGYRITRYDIKTRKYRQIKKAVDSITQQYGCYLVFSNPHGDASPVKLYTYNTLTGTNKTISYKSNWRSIQNGVLYYLDWSKSNTKGYLKRCKLNGSSVKTLASVPSLDPTLAHCAFGPSYVIVYTINYNYEYTNLFKVYYSTGKKAPATLGELEKILQY